MKYPLIILILITVYLPSAAQGEVIRLKCEKASYGVQPVITDGTTQPGTVLHPEKNEVVIDYSKKTLVVRALEKSERELFKDKQRKKYNFPPDPPDKDTFNIVNNTKTQVVGSRMDDNEYSFAIQTIIIGKKNLRLIKTFSALSKDDGWMLGENSTHNCVAPIN